MNIFRFESPVCLFFLGLIPVYLAVVVLWNRNRRHSLRRLALVTGALAMMAVGLARPQFGHAVTQAQAFKSQIFLAVDISKSMLVEDLPPSRLAFAKAFLFRLLPSLSAAKFALYPFTQDGYLQLPLTSDEAAAADVIASLNPNVVSNQGTDFTKSLETLFSLISRLEHRARGENSEWLPTQVLILSDGESHQPASQSILKLYRTKKIPIHTVGLGSELGGPIPAERRGFDESGRVKDASGRIVQSKLDTKTLKAISTETGGSFFMGGFERLPELAKTLRQTATLGSLSTQFKVERELFPYCFLIALALLMGSLFMQRWQLVLQSSLWLFCCAAPQSFAQSPEEPPAHTMDDATRAVLLFNQGVTKLKENVLPRAAELFAEAAELTPNPKLRKQALYNQGNALLKQMDPAQAKEIYQRAMDTRSGSEAFDKEVNTRTSENLALAAEILESMQKSPGNEEAPGSDGTGNGTDSPDPKGPKQFKGQDFDSNQKKKIFDLISSEEQQTMQRMMEQRNKGQGHELNLKPW